MTDTARAFGTFFGSPWPSGICDEGRQVETPVGEPCEMCGEAIQVFDRGSFIGAMRGEEGNWVPILAPVHRECSLRSVMGGIGHLQNHLTWCLERHDPDAGFSYRQSALMVWDWIADHGFPTREEP
jgi:hypothetical protein